MRKIVHFIAGKDFEDSSENTASVFAPNTGEVQAEVSLATLQLWPMQLKQPKLHRLSGQQQILNDALVLCSSIKSWLKQTAIA